MQQIKTNFQINIVAMAIGELRALPIGRGQIGKVKYIPVGVQSRGGRGIPSSVIKTGVKLPQMECVQQPKEKVIRHWQFNRADNLCNLFYNCPKVYLHLEIIF